jgi:hypothetical protein
MTIKFIAAVSLMMLGSLSYAAEFEKDLRSPVIRKLMREHLLIDGAKKNFPICKSAVDKINHSIDESRAVQEGAGKAGIILGASALVCFGSIVFAGPSTFSLVATTFFGCSTGVMAHLVTKEHKKLNELNEVQEYLMDLSHPTNNEVQKLDTFLASNIKNVEWADDGLTPSKLNFNW